MPSYTLYDMQTSVRLGYWNGGFVEKIGCVGSAVSDNKSNTICGVKGLYISPTIMIESIKPSESGGHTLGVSYYDPYEGEFVKYILPLSSIKDDLSLLTLMSITEDDEVLRRGMSS